jgi:predicted ATPase/DNA-binding SARP family transcriptional activator/predicted negative regulator of RcsB-dependent stress response
LTLALFGSLQITLDGEPITARLWAKPQALLAYLAVQADAPHRREYLAGLLWGEQSDDAARTSLRQALRQLHQAFGDNLEHFLVITPQTIQFNPNSDCQLDVTEFAALIRVCDQHPHRQRETCRACVERLQRAAALYRGDLLAGFFLKDSTPFEEWALVKREQLRHQAVAALATLAEHYARRGEFALMEQAARRQIEIEPLYEGAHRQVMRALTWRGQRNAALAQFENLRKTLAEEIGAPPEKETLALEANIRAGTCARLPALTNVPHPLTSFIGREREIAEVKHLLETTRLLTLTGAGGCGKTRLALQVATAIVHANHFKDGVWWVDLAALSDPALVPQAVAAPFDLSESPGISLTNVLTNYLSSRQPLLILDNCEHLIEACAQLAETLLGACPQLRILATSRQALGVGGEVTWRVPSLALPRADQPQTAEEILRCDAIQLFVERALTVAPNWKLTEHTETVAAICARLDGIPLALELAAARLKMLSVKQIAARLDARFDLLTNGSRTALPRHQTLRATMDWSYDLLSDEECALLRRLSVFAGGWTLEAAEAICAEDNSSVLDSMTALIDKSLVVVDQTDIAMRYRMLETVHEYAGEKLIASGEAEVIRDRHLDFFIAFAEEIEPKLRGAEQFQWLDRLAIEHDNLRAALEWSRGDGRVQRGLRLAGALAWFWRMGAHWTESQARVENLLRQPEATAKTLTRARALFAATLLAGRLGDFRSRGQRLEETIAIARELGQAGKGLLAVALAFSVETTSVDKIIPAQALLNEGWSVAQELGDEWTSAIVLWQRGHWLVVQKNYQAARRTFETSLALFRSVGDKYSAMRINREIARLCFEEGDYGAARLQEEQNLTFFRQVKDRRDVFATLNTLGEIARAEGQYEQARKYYEESLAIKRELGSKTSIVVALMNLGITVAHLGDMLRAKELFVESCELVRETAWRSGMIIVLVFFAGLAIAQKQAEQAARVLGVVEPWLKSLDARVTTPADVVEFERNLASVRAQLDEATFNAAWAEGQKMTLERAVEYALQTSEVSETSEV